MRITFDALTAALVALPLFATISVFAPVAHAQEADESEPHHLAPGMQLSLKLEPGLATALTDPQRDRTDVGMGHTVKVLFGVHRYLQVGPSFAYTRLPADAAVMAEAGTSWTLGGGARLMRPHDAPGLGIAPWVDVDLVYARTGALSRPGFATAVGVSMPLDNRRRFWVGPFARYYQIIDDEDAGFDGRDAKILMFGIGLEITTGLERKREPIVAVVEPAPPGAPSDRDGDTVIDSADNCPDVAGPVENDGCPVYSKVVVKREKLEVKETIAFGWDSAVIEPTSYPALDEVVRALQDNRGFKVQIDGHASSEGTYDHNQALSEARALAVLDYLVSKGVAKERLVSKGFSESVPTETNTTAEGRDSNRRVEFILEFIIVTESKTP